MDEYASGVNVYEIAANFERQGGPGFDDHVHAGLQMDLLACAQSILHPYLLLKIHTGIQRDRATDLFVLVSLDLKVGVSADLLELVLFDFQMCRAGDRLEAAVFDPMMEILLRMNENLLTTLFIFKS